MWVLSSRRWRLVNLQWACGQYTQECSGSNRLHLLLEWHAWRCQSLPALHQGSAVDCHQWHFVSPCGTAIQPASQPQQCEWRWSVFTMNYDNLFGDFLSFWVESHLLQAAMKEIMHGQMWSCACVVCVCWQSVGFEHLATLILVKLPASRPLFSSTLWMLGNRWFFSLPRLDRTHSCLVQCNHAASLGSVKGKW